MKTRSIYQGFMVHITVAGLIDWLALRHRKATPIHLWPTEAPALGKAWMLEEEKREAVAQTVELMSIIIAGIQSREQNGAIVSIPSVIEQAGR